MSDLPATATRAQRLERAQAVLAAVLQRHGENVLAVGVYGSTGRGEDEPYSDLEMCVVVREPVDDNFEEYVDGWKLELEFRTAEELLTELSEVDIEWPITGGQYQNVLPLHDPTGFWDSVRARAAALPDGLFREATRAALVGEWLEPVGKYRNARLRGDAGFQRWAAWQLAWYALGVVGLANRHFYPSRTRAFPDSLGLPRLPDGYPELVALFEAGDLTDLAELDRRLERLHAGMLGLAKELGLELEVDGGPF